MLRNRMRRAKVLMCVALMGCSTTWGGGEGRDFAKDRYQCTRELPGYLCQGLSCIGTQRQRAEIFDECMEANGWVKQ